MTSHAQIDTIVPIESRREPGQIANLERRGDPMGTTSVHPDLWAVHDLLTLIYERHADKRTIRHERLLREVITHDNAKEALALLGQHLRPDPGADEAQT